MKSKAEYIKRRGTTYRQLRSGAAKCMYRLERHNLFLAFGVFLDDAIKNNLENPTFCWRMNIKEEN